MYLCEIDDDIISNIDNTQDTFGSASSADMERLGTASLDGLAAEPMERTGTSTESSDSEKEYVESHC